MKLSQLFIVIIANTCVQSSE